MTFSGRLIQLIPLTKVKIYIILYEYIIFKYIFHSIESLAGYKLIFIILYFMCMNLFTLPISGQKILGKINKVRIMGHGKLIQYYTTAL